MARVTGPLMSVDASGTIAKSVTFAKWKGRNYTRRWATPSNPRSGLQTAVRAMLRFLSQYWATLATLDQESWNTQAASLKISAFNAFVRQGQMRLKQGLTPCQANTGNHNSDAIVTDTPTTAGTGRSVTVNVANTGLTNEWGTKIYRKLAGAPTGALSELVAVIPFDAGAAIFEDVVPTAGTWHYKAQAFD